MWNLLLLIFLNFKLYSDYRFWVIVKNKVGSSNFSNVLDMVRILEIGKKIIIEIWLNVILFVYVNELKSFVFVILSIFMFVFMLI